MRDEALTSNPSDKLKVRSRYKSFSTIYLLAWYFEQAVLDYCQNQVILPWRYKGLDGEGSNAKKQVEPRMWN